MSMASPPGTTWTHGNIEAVLRYVDTAGGLVHGLNAIVRDGTPWKGTVEAVS